MKGARARFVQDQRQPSRFCRDLVTPKHTINNVCCCFGMVLTKGLSLLLRLGELAQNTASSAAARRCCGVACHKHLVFIPVIRVEAYSPLLRSPPSARTRTEPGSCTPGTNPGRAGRPWAGRWGRWRRSRTRSGARTAWAEEREGEGGGGLVTPGCQRQVEEIDESLTNRQER